MQKVILEPWTILLMRKMQRPAPHLPVKLASSESWLQFWLNLVSRLESFLEWQLSTPCMNSCSGRLACTKNAWLHGTVLKRFTIQSYDKNSNAAFNTWICLENTATFIDHASRYRDFAWIIEESSTQIGGELGIFGVSSWQYTAYNPGLLQPLFSSIQMAPMTLTFQDSKLHLRLLGRLSNSNSLNLVTGIAIQTIHIDELVQGMVMWCDL